MHVDVTRPKQTDTEGLKVPVVYETSPYYSRQGEFSQSHFWDAKHELGATPPKHENLQTSLRELRRPMIANSHVRRWLPLGFAVCIRPRQARNFRKVVQRWVATMNRWHPKPLSIGCVVEPKVIRQWMAPKKSQLLGVQASRNGRDIVQRHVAIGRRHDRRPGLEAIIRWRQHLYYHYYRSNGLVRHPGGYMGEDIDVRTTLL